MLRYFKIIAILCLISSLARFVLDSYLPSLPAIAATYGITDTAAELTLTLYLFGFSLSQLVYGPLSDRYGRRIVIILGLTIFALGNILCALSNAPEVLMLARIIAGVGAGACGVLNRAIASDCFKGAEFAKAWSYTTSALVITLCIAPVIGGYMQEMAGWRGNFVLSTIFVGVALGFILKYLPETNKQLHVSSFNIKKISRDYLTIFTTREFITGSLCYALAFAGLIVYFQTSPMLFINHFKLSPSTYGWCALVIAVNYLMGGMIVNRFAARMGTRYLLLIGACLMIAGGLIMTIMALMGLHHVFAVLFPAAIYVIGARIVIPNAIAGSMEKLRHLNGSTSALLGFMQMLISSVISMWVATFDHATALPMSGFLIGLGFTTLLTVIYMMKPQWLSEVVKSTSIIKSIVLNTDNKIVPSKYIIALRIAVPAICLVFIHNFFD